VCLPETRPADALLTSAPTACRYVNFLICNGKFGKGIVAPALGVPESDARYTAGCTEGPVERMHNALPLLSETLVLTCRAKQVLQDVFPGWQVEMVPLGREILLGWTHCVPCTMLLHS
jgi:agmatine/peptidylarginine deiminase